MQHTRIAPRTRSRKRTGNHKRLDSSAIGRGVSVLAVCVLGVAALLALNWIYQVVRKPAEMLAPVGTALTKSPRATWQTYGPLFQANSTAIMTSELLAALAQVEGQGNPLARTYWRWRLSLNPFDLYRPASSAVGMFQITDATFAEARSYCIRAHEVVRDGPWYDVHSCWFNGLYSRLRPADAIEMTAANLHRRVTGLLGAPRAARASLAQQQDLAALIHLCGPARGERFVRRGFRVAPGERCGDQSVRDYLDRVNLMKRQFVRLQAG